MPKVINIEPTPNPNALKFVVKHSLLSSGGARSFRDFASAVGDPLGSAIFALGGVATVFYMDRFVTVNKLSTVAWEDLIDPICEAIEERGLDNRASHTANNANNVNPKADDVFQKIIDVIDYRIRPGLAGDGGGLDIISFDGQTLTIAYQGACGNCPAAGTSTLQFIEGLIQHEVDPSIRVAVL